MFSKKSGMRTPPPERRRSRGDPLESLAQKREHLYGPLRETGDFRRKIISVIDRQGGKKKRTVPAPRKVSRGLSSALGEHDAEREKVCEEPEARPGVAEIPGGESQPARLFETR